MSANDNEFDMEFDFEGEYGTPEESSGDDKFDLKSILGSDFDMSILDTDYEQDFDYGPDNFQEEPEEEAAEEPEEPAEAEAEPEADAPEAEEEPDELYDAEEDEEEYEEDDDEDDETESEVTENIGDDLPEDEQSAEEKPAKQLKPRKSESAPKPAFRMPNIALPKLNLPAKKPREEAPAEGRKPMSPIRRFKNDVLPNVILGIAAVLIVVFVVGSISRAVKIKKLNNEADVQASNSAVSAAEAAQQEAQRVLDKAATLAASYDYDGAIEVLNGFTGDVSKFPEISNQLSNYSQIKSTLVEHNDPGAIANLSFHVLVADPARSFTSQPYGGKFNQNFVTTDEFEKILQQLYENNYVLVDMSSFIAETETGGTISYSAKPLRLPDGKKPIMLTETLANYLYYMVDSDDDLEPDKGGAGFASRLVLDAAGNIKAEMVDSNGNTVVGNYDLVPILEDFIAAHPDFSYQGSRAIVAVCGYNGVFGYRTQSSVIQSKGQDYYNEQVQGAKIIAEALKNKGYTIACYTYENKDYAKMTAQEIQSEMDLWRREVTPIVGELDTFVFAQSSDISTTGAYSGSRFNVLQSEGFRYFIGNANRPSADVTNAYVRQLRVMVTGSNMANASTMYNDYFDAKAVLNSQRGNVPQ